jgi:hypothetical protein
MMRICVPCALLLALMAPAPGLAQSELTRRCSSATAAVQPFCNLVADAIETAQPRVGLALSGGNPVPGAASTLGTRVRKPQVSVAARVTGVPSDFPGIENFATNDESAFFLPGINLDASIGVFNGFSLAPTVGGFASVDLIASAGTVPVPEDDGFDSGRVSGWGLGARIGILRESFTAPGVSLSAM